MSQSLVWTQNVSDKEYIAPEGYISQDKMANKMVKLIVEEFKRRGYEVTPGGRKELRESYKNKMKQPSELEIQEGEGNDSPESAAIKFVSLALENKNEVFSQGHYTRIATRPVKNAVGVIEKIAKALEKCPVWPFC